MSTMLLSLFLVGNAAWPFERVRRALIMAVAFGVAYTVFSEWLNIVVRAAWAYRHIMPVVPIVDTGLTHLLQWVIVPTVAYIAALRHTRDARGEIGRTSSREIVCLSVSLSGVVLTF